MARGIGVSLRSERQHAGGIDELSLRQFAEELSRGEILTAIGKKCGAGSVS
jgi:hypothetical protein